MKRKTRLIVAGSVIAIILVFFLFSFFRKDGETTLDTIAEKGTFDIIVNVTGELQAENSEKIMGPSELRSRNIRIGNIKIQDLIPEGTVVKEGEYVATLDRSEADNNLKDVMDEVEQRMSDYTKTKLDTTIQLRNLRDDLINLEFNMEEAKIKLEQSKFEPPATIRQAEIDLDKAERAYQQAKQNYILKVQQAKADMRQVSIELAKEQRRQQEMKDLLDKFIIRAPSGGMVIYHREWNGQKRKVGSTINGWDLTVATLPDLNSMISKTYVNEIDISKINKGQKVEVGVDAFPGKKYTGEVIDVANIGEQLPNTDAKVFEVVIKINESDPILRPSMTTSNVIMIKEYEDVIHLPLEAVHADDSLTFVYRKNGTKQLVLLGEANENEVIIEKGVEEGEKIYLSLPSNHAEFKVTGAELAEEIIARKKQQEQVNDNTSENDRAKRGSRSGFPMKREGTRKSNN